LLALSQQEQGAIFLLEKFISLPKENIAIRDTKVSFGMIEMEEGCGFLIVILVSYLSVGAILGREGNSITSIHMTREP
jgi:hypothetical protein